jgi:hypothetical protein
VDARIFESSDQRLGKKPAKTMRNLAEDEREMS